MHTLIITDNIRQAQFLKKGFQCENLSADVYFFDHRDLIEKNLLFFDGVFLLVDDVSILKDLSVFCRSIKSKIPIIFMVQNDAFAKRKLFYELKANYYSARPFIFRKIVAEMKISIFRNKEHIERSEFSLRGLHLDLLSHQVRFKSKVINLRNKEFALLHFLMINIGRVLSRATILENVWDRNASILTNTVDVHISQLRKKISNFSDDNYIHTIPCTGYIFA